METLLNRQQRVLGKRVLGEEQFKWTSKLMGLDFEIKYKPECENRAADALLEECSMQLY